MGVLLRTALIVSGIVVLLCPGITGQELAGKRRPVVFQIRLENESINPATARFFKRCLQEAAQEQAECLIVVLDTPGGLLSSTRDMVKNILHSRVPVVVYVAPRGARAGSAGVFITLASHVAAMAPGTNIGAAHPVQIGGVPGSPPADDKGKDQPSVMEQKIVNDTVAWAKSLCELRGRNADWAVRTIKESLSVTASEAFKAKAVEILAADEDDLLKQLDGREVVLSWAMDDQGKWVAKETTRLYTANAEVRDLEMWWGERILVLLADPNVAFLLLILGFYGIVFEFYTPGWGVAGTLGVICLVLGFFALSILPVNYVGLALIAVALAMFVAEVFVTSFGFLTLGGMVCLILGGLMLVESPLGFQRISLWVLVPVAVATGLIVFFLVGSIVKTHRTRIQTGGEGLTGMEATAAGDFTSDKESFTGKVRIHGEFWNAVSPAPVSAGHRVVVTGRDGLTLFVANPSDEQQSQFFEKTTHHAPPIEETI